ncbi:hypothetical protein BTS2_1211 [Bacillus sp. TS-2]|nr:hypothetical protein BTS2_1211 [Bacillus sp. TS-2]
MLNSDEQLHLQEILEWESTYFTKANQSIFKEWKENETLPRFIKNTEQIKIPSKYLEQLEALMIQLQSMVQNERSEQVIWDKILRYARVFNPDIHSINEMKKLTIDQQRFLSEQFMAKQRLIAVGQGSVTGLGGLLTISLDLPLLAAIQLRTIQQLALIHGYDPKNPIEQVIALKLFYLTTLPKPYQLESWQHLFAELEFQNEEHVFYDGQEHVFDQAWMGQLMKQMGKNIIIRFLRKRWIQGVPLFGVAIGAGVNYQLTKQVTEMAERFYQKRILLSKLHNNV